MKNCYLALEKFRKLTDDKYPEAWCESDANKFF